MQTIDKREILQKIFTLYHDWFSGREFACARGCSLCCTRKVMVTAPEGELVLEQISRDPRQDQLAASLAEGENPVCHLTMNEWADRCIPGSESREYPEPEISEPCQLLAEDLSCPIYPARPFACRCFASLRPCQEDGSASQPRDLIAVNTAVMQIIEHLGQGEIYGALGNVLPVLCNRDEYQDLARFLPSGSGSESRAFKGLRRARPLTAFVTEPGDRETVADFLKVLFQERVGGSSLRALLNNG